MTFEEWCRQFDNDKRSALSGAEFIIAREAWDAATKEANYVAVQTCGRLIYAAGGEVLVPMSVLYSNFTVSMQSLPGHPYTQMWKATKEE